MSFTAEPAFYYMQFSRGEEEEDLAAKGPRERPLSKEQQLADAATQRLIEQYEELYKLRQADVVVPLVEKWRTLEAMRATEEKQALLEDLIQKVQRKPEIHEGELIFILLVLEPLRRSLCAKLLRGLGVSKSDPEPERHRRHESRMIDRLARAEFYDAARSATLELVHAYPVGRQGRVFGWFQSTLSHRLLTLYLCEYLTENRSLSQGEQARIGNFLHGLDSLEPQELRERQGLRQWRRLVGDMRPVFSAVDEYSKTPQVRRICREAIDRLTPRRRDTMLDYFFNGLTLEQIAEQNGVAVSTVGNNKSQAEEKLRQDDIFYCALDSLGVYRSELRRRKIVERFPDGVLPDGRRHFFIDPVD